MATDDVLIITGASTGIGAETARAASAAGYRLVLAARSEEKLTALAEELGGSERAIGVPTDVTDWAANEALVAAAIEAFGRVDAVFANAGFGASRGWLNESPEHWRDMVLTNVLGCAFTVRAALPALKESSGHIFVTGSVAGRVAIPGSLYSATKHAVHAMGESIRADVDGTGIRTTIIAPGMVETPFFDDKPENALLPEDIAGAVMYALAQPARVDVNEILVRPTPQPS